MIDLLKGVASKDGFDQQALDSRLVEAMFVYILRVRQDNESRRTGQRKELVSDGQTANAFKRLKGVSPSRFRLAAS